MADFTPTAGNVDRAEPCFASDEDARAWLTKVFADVFSPAANRQVYARYFHPDYVQRVDGKTLSYDAAMHHLDVVNSAASSVDISFDKVLVSGRWIAESHSVRATFHDGRSSAFSLIALIRIEAGRIIEVEELTHQADGDTSARDLGSRE